MVIDNRKIVIKLKLQSRIIAFLMVVSIALVLIPDVPEIICCKITKLYLSISLTGIFILDVIYRYNMDFNYIYYSDDNNKIIFRYYSLRPFNDLKSSVEIQKKELAYYEIKKSFFNLREKIILFQKTKNGIAKYPQVSISALSKKDSLALKKSLASYIN